MSETGEIVLLKAALAGANSLLLDVQKECVTLRMKLDEQTKQIEKWRAIECRCPPPQPCPRCAALDFDGE